MHSRCFASISRYFSSSPVTKPPKLKNLSKILAKHRPRAIEEAQNALTDYLYATKNLPFIHAEHISKNSIFSLSEIIAKVEFSLSGFSTSLQSFLRYHPINEFKFFYESIGINSDEIDGFLPVNKFFLAEDYRVFNAACALWEFGFPWNRLGKLCKEEISIFYKDSSELNERLVGFKEYGFDNVMIIGICLNYPFVLSGNCELGGEIDGLFDDLRKVFVHYDMISCVEGNVDAWSEVCRKIRIFYDLGCVKGKMGKLMGRSRNVFLEHPEEILVQKVKYFSKLDVNKLEIGYLLLSSPEILRFDLESPCISVSGFLKYYGLEENQLRLIMENYPYVMGRNRISNLPHVLRSLDLNEWFFNKMRNGDHNLLARYVIGSPEEDLDEIYTDFLMRIPSTKKHFHTRSKLNFLHSIGFGENELTIKILARMSGTSSDLQERFDWLLHSGVEFSKLCKMISISRMILNKQKEQIEQSVKYLCEDIGFSLQYLDIFPSYLRCSLEKRIKPRYRFLMWLIENGLCAKEYSLSSIISKSEKQLIAHAYRMHPAAPKMWLENFKAEDSHIG